MSEPLEQLVRSLGHAWTEEDLAAVLEKHGGDPRRAHRFLVDLQGWISGMGVLIAPREAWIEALRAHDWDRERAAEALAGPRKPRPPSEPEVALTLMGLGLEPGMPKERAEAILASRRDVRPLYERQVLVAVEIRIEGMTPQEYDLAYDPAGTGGPRPRRVGRRWRYPGDPDHRLTLWEGDPLRVVDDWSPMLRRLGVIESSG